MGDPITTAETAKRLGVSVSYVHYLDGIGRLPHVRKLDGPRGAKLFDPVAVDAFKRSRDAA